MYTLEIQASGKCVAFVTVKDINNLTWIVRDKKSAPNSSSQFKKPKQVSSFWLFVKDIEKYFVVSQEYANEIADHIWPEFNEDEREEYNAEALYKKNLIRENGYCNNSPVDLLTEKMRIKVSTHIQKDNWTPVNTFQLVC